MAQFVDTRASHFFPRRPRRTSHRSLILAIVHSIQEAAARGETRTPDQYTPRVETQALVWAVLRHQEASLHPRSGARE